MPRRRNGKRRKPADRGDRPAQRSRRGRRAEGYQQTTHAAVLQGSHCPAINSLNSRSGRFAIASLANVARSFLAKCADKDGVQAQADLQLLNGKLTLAFKHQVVPTSSSGASTGST